MATLKEKLEAAQAEVARIEGAIAAHKAKTPDYEIVYGEVCAEVAGYELTLTRLNAVADREAMAALERARVSLIGGDFRAKNVSTWHPDFAAAVAKAVDWPVEDLEALNNATHVYITDLSALAEAVMKKVRETDELYTKARKMADAASPGRRKEYGDAERRKFELQVPWRLKGDLSEARAALKDIEDSIAADRRTGGSGNDDDKAARKRVREYDKLRTAGRKKLEALRKDPSKLVW